LLLLLGTLKPWPGINKQYLPNRFRQRCQKSQTEETGAQAPGYAGVGVQGSGKWIWSSSDFINCISNLVIFCIVRISCVAGGHSTCFAFWSGWVCLGLLWSPVSGESWTGFGWWLRTWTAANHAIAGALLAPPALYPMARERHLLTGSVRFLQLLWPIFHFHLIFMIYLCADASWLFSYRPRIYAFRFGSDSDSGSGPGSIHPYSPAGSSNF